MDSYKNDYTLINDLTLKKIDDGEMPILSYPADSLVLCYSHLSQVTVLIDTRVRGREKKRKEKKRKERKKVTSLFPSCQGHPIIDGKS